MGLCKYMGKECPESLAADAGDQDVWTIIDRLSSYGESRNRIPHSADPADIMLAQRTPFACAQIYSTRGLPFGADKFRVLHSCAECKKRVTEVLERAEVI